MTQILIIKTGALGDVLRTTSVLPGLHERYPAARIEWITAPAAVQLVERHPGVARTIALDPRDEAGVRAFADAQRDRRWDWLISLDDEPILCELASRLACDRLSGATLDAAGERVYTDDVAPWFEMGLLSRLGKEAADRRKLENTRSHPEIFAAMLGVPMGRPELPLPAEAEAFGEAFASRHALGERGAIVGLNTGAGGRWRTKGLPARVVVEFVRALHAERGGAVEFVLLGGPEERERNAEIVRCVAALGDESVPSADRPSSDGPSSDGPSGAAPKLTDGGTENSLTEFAAIVSRLDLLLSSDSLALHVAIARRIPLVAFFAPTSAAEIDLYDSGEKVQSTAPDYCSYRPDADNSTLTPERLVAAAARVLDRGRASRGEAR